MAGELNTDVLDDPASCRGAADWLGRAAAGVKQIGDTVYRERGESESFWQGEAGDACRARLSDEGHDSDEAERLITGVQQALLAFAREIDAVKAAMDTARQDASAAGLIVTPTAILPAGPAPTPVPDGPVAPDHQAQYDAAKQSYQSAKSAFTAKQQAFNRVQAAVNRARADQNNAHQALDKAVIDPLAGIKRLKTYGIFVVGKGLTYVKSMQGAANDLLRNADDIGTHANRMQAIADDPTLPEASRAAATQAASVSTQAAERAQADFEKVQGTIGKIPGPARTAIEWNPGNLIKDGKGLLKLAKGAARGLPVVGTGIAIVSTAVDVGMGEPLGQATAETGAGIGGGIAGGMAGAELGAAIGSVFPGAGTAVGGVVGGIVGGIIGSMSGTKAVDQGMGVAN